MTISTAIDLTAVARVVGIKTAFKDLRGGNILFLPQRIAVVGQGSTVSVYDTAKRQVTSALEAANLYGFGSPIHLAVLQLLPINGDGVGTIPVTIYPLEDDVAGVAAAGDTTPTGTVTESAEWRILIGNIRSEAIVGAVGDTATDIGVKTTLAVNAALNIPMVPADGLLGITDYIAKWEGTSGNDLVITIEGPTDAGITWAITQPVGGLVNPNIDAALAQVGNIWETMMLNCLDIADTVTLDKYSTFGEGRWGALVRKPLMIFSGNTATTVAAATVISDARKTDRVNSQLVAPGSNDLPFVVAARELARIAPRANNNPPFDYGSLQATGLTPGLDGVQWTYQDRDQAVKKGSSTIEVKDGVINTSDTVTFYHPTGDAIPAYRYVVDIVKLQNILFNIDLIFATPEWDGAPLIPDNQPTVNPDAKQPKMAKADVAAMLDSLGLNAIISDPESAKSSILAAISDNNPKRLDLSVTIKIVGNSNIISIDLDWGFFFSGTVQ